MTLAKAGMDAPAGLVDGVKKAGEHHKNIRRARHDVRESVQQCTAAKRGEVDVTKTTMAEGVEKTKIKMAESMKYVTCQKEAMDAAALEASAPNEADREMARKTRLKAQNDGEAALSTLEASDEDGRAHAAILRANSVFGPEAVDKGIRKITSAGTHHNERVRQALKSSGIEEAGKHGQFSSVVDMGDWPNTGAIREAKTQKGAEGAGAFFPSPGSPDSTWAAPRLAMTINSGKDEKSGPVEAMAEFSLVGCEDWSKPGKSEAVEVAKIRVKDMHAISSALEGATSAKAQKDALDDLLQAVQNSSSPDKDSLERSIAQTTKMIDLAGEDGIPAKQVVAMGALYSIGHALNDNFNALSVENHTPHIKAFNKALLGEVPDPKGEGLWNGGWTPDPAVLAHRQIIQINQAYEDSTKPNADQRYFKHQQSIYRCQDERDEIALLGASIQV